MRSLSYRSHSVFHVSTRRLLPGGAAARDAPPAGRHRSVAGSHACGVPAVKNGARRRRGSRARPASELSIRSTPVARSQTSSPSASKNSTRCHGMSPPGTKAGSGIRLGAAPRWLIPITNLAGSKRASQRTR